MGNVLTSVVVWKQEFVAVIDAVERRRGTGKQASGGEMVGQANYGEKSGLLCEHVERDALICRGWLDSEVCP